VRLIGAVTLKAAKGPPVTGDPSLIALDDTGASALRMTGVIIQVAEC